MRTESEEFQHYGKVLFIQSSVENGWYIIENGWHIVENGIVENGWCIPHIPPSLEPLLVGTLKSCLFALIYVGSATTNCVP